MSSRSVGHDKRYPLDNLKRYAFRVVKFDSVDRATIVGVIAIFGALFMWLLGRNDQPFYTYLTFLVLVTLVLVGILRAVGIFQTPIMLFGGAAAVFAGLYLLTVRSYEKSYDQSAKISVLTCSDPACAALKRYFSSIEKKDFKTAISLLSDPWKQRQEAANGKNYYEVFPTLFETTLGYDNFSYLFRGKSDQKAYSVSYDVTDEVPKNELYDKRKQVLSSLTAAYNPNELANVVIANLSDYYAVPPDKKAAIAKYIDDHVTIEEAIDPFFISQLVIHLRRGGTADLKSAFSGNPKTQIKRHFVHRVAMTQEPDGWKILAIESSYIANYIPVY